MPVTPFHFGAGLAAKGAAPARFSFLIFCATQIAIDCESGYHLLKGDQPVHRTLHTLLGASVICCAVALAVRWAVPSLRISPRTALVSAAAGVIGHVVPDGIMHEDVRPFGPFTDWNPIYGTISLPLLHRTLVVAGAVGVALWLWRGKAGNRSSAAGGEA